VAENSVKLSDQLSLEVNINGEEELLESHGEKQTNEEFIQLEEVKCLQKLKVRLRRTTRGTKSFRRTGMSLEYRGIAAGM
jgi:hypothetical protein